MLISKGNLHIKISCLSSITAEKITFLADTQTNEQSKCRVASLLNSLTQSVQQLRQTDIVLLCKINSRKDKDRYINISCKKELEKIIISCVNYDNL